MHGSLLNWLLSSAILSSDRILLVTARGMSKTGRLVGINQVIMLLKTTTPCDRVKHALIKFYVV